MSEGSGIWVALGAVALGACFSTLYFSLRSVTGVGVDEVGAKRRARESRVALARRIADEADTHALAIALPRILFNMIAAVSFVWWIWHLRSGGATGAVSAPTWVDVTIGIGVSAAVLWLFSAAVPYSIAQHGGNHVVFTFAPVIRALYLPMVPLLGLSRLFDEIARRLAGADDEAEDEHEAELLDVVERGEREGRFDEDEAEMIEAVVDFKSTTVDQIMTPRTEVEAFELTDNLGKVTDFIRECHHSRIPVYEGSLDKIVGIFYVKDLLHWLAGEGVKGGGRAFDLRALVRPAVFVPEVKTVRELLGEMLGKRVHIAIVADEYGGTSGIVTIEDIVEEIFGDIQDEYEEPIEDQPVSVDTEARAAEVDARERIDDVNDHIEAFGIELPESEDYDTVGGFVVTALGRIPSAGEQVSLESLRVTVLEAEPTRVLRVRIEASSPDDRTGDSGVEPSGK